MKLPLLGNYYEGSFNLSPVSGRNSAETFFERLCPADLDTLLYQCPVEYTHVDKVLESAEHGYKLWRKTTLEQRVNALKRYQEQVIVNRDRFASSISLETGKSILEAEEEVQLVISKVDISISEGIKRIEDQNIDHLIPGGNAHISRRPIGPCLIISPANLPAHLPNGEIVAALLAGNSIILKPSEKTVHSGQILIECFHKADFPAGVINFIAGDDELTRRLIRAKESKGIFFTGSKEVGKMILEYATDDLSKSVSLALGSKNTCIVDKGIDLDKVVSDTVKAAFKTTGQRCTSTSILAIHSTMLDEFVSKFHDASKMISIGHPLDNPAPTIGPLLDQRTMDNYLLYVGMAKREGLEEIMRGKILERKNPGYYVSPSIHLAKKYDPTSMFIQTEIFGPSLTIIPFSTVEDSIAIANASEYGLTTSIYSSDNEFINYCSDELECGQINVNCPTISVNARLPFSGIKNSGNYHPGGIRAIEHSIYTRTIYREN